MPKMSGTAKTGTRADTAYNEENEIIYDPFPSYAINRPCADLPWPEWSDAELNAEVWDEGKAQKSSPSGGAKGATVPRPLFDDPNPPKLPPLLEDFVHSWKRPNEVFGGENGSEELRVFDSSDPEFELCIPSEVSPECEFFKVFIDEMRILQFYASKHKFQVELESSTFVSTTQGEVWRPWHHVYALCKAGKGQIHKPSYNPYGKYVVRLYYLGAWRKFVVDDKIPCDVEGSPLIPVSQSKAELWPIILTKALLKILSLTPTDKFSVTDFPFLSAFTGWVYGCFLSKNKSTNQVWNRLLCLILRYEQSSGEAVVEEKPVAPPVKVHQKKESAKRGESRKEVEVVEIKNEKFCFLMANLNLDDSLELAIGITMVRDCPLIKAVRREKTKPWKRLRWTNWAKEKGLWVDDNLLPPYKRLQIITYDKKIRTLLYPDPTLEPALYEVPMEDEKEIESNIEDVPEMWCDFLKFMDSVSRISTFFKPSCFFGTFKISCLPQKTSEGTSGGKSTPGGKRTTKNATPFQNTFTYPTGIKQSCNEPIFLLCESPVGIFLCISLWVYPMKSKSLVGYLDPNQPKLLKVAQASLIVELHDWRSCEQGELIGLIETVGYSSLPLTLRAGRYVLKLWLSTESPYVINIYSSSNVYVNRSPRIRYLMSSESQRIISYINNVSTAFIALTQKFGKPDLAKGLRDFYNIIKPGNDYAVNYLGKLDVFIETFLNCILLSLRDLIPNPDEVWIMVGAMRCLFINPALLSEFPIKTHYVPSENGDSLTLPHPINTTWSSVDAQSAVTIQRFFRGYRIRLLWKCQTPARKEFKFYSERLKKICDTLFVPQKRELEVGKLLRKIVMTRPDLLTTFKFYEDFANVLQVEEFTGKMTNVEPFAWVPITRFVVGCHSEGLVPCFFYLSCNLERVVIQGFNNDTGEEIFRVTNSVSPHYYHSNVKGYTILAFGWNEANFKTVNWRLEMVKMKHFQVIHLCNLLMSSTCQPYAMPSLEIFEIRNFYVPNSKSRICRCLIKIQKQALLTLRLSLSYPEVHFELIISLEKESSESRSSTPTENRVVWRVVSKNGVAIVPSLLLECHDSMWLGETSSPTVFSVEAFVLNNSWPLTKQEWGLVEPLRVNGENGRDSSTSLLSRRGRPESKRKMGRSSRKTLSEPKITDNPLWVLQVLNDSSGQESAEPIVIEEDRSHAEAVKAMKASWREKDPGRKKRGRDLRMNFLYRMLLENRRSRVYGEDEENYEGEGETEDPQWLLDRLSSFSYLLNDTSPTRYTYSPRILPDMPLMELLCKYRREPEDHTMSAIQLSTMKDVRSDEDDDTEISFSIVRNMIDELEEDRRDFSTQCSHYRTVLLNHLIEEQKISNRLMEQAYEERLKALESFTR